MCCPFSAHNFSVARVRKLRHRDISPKGHSLPSAQTSAMLCLVMTHQTCALRVLLPSHL